MSKLLIHLEPQVSAHLYCSTNLEKATPPQIKPFYSSRTAKCNEHQENTNTKTALMLEALKSFQFLIAL